ncbi:hypothetical protein SAMN06272755_2474 [Picosynechococcus sp. OG1]|nr:hypothetical protein SYNPCC7002_A2333 [Picosynechococcus sp. PCC 7002]SMH52419.1 hypothetical protein SAMN06272755_2474 [Picosynechococcus sp. OG1]SMQ82309.1 hypothetical protein SAMN06272774_1748 [Synechococcus sp. 7002]
MKQRYIYSLLFLLPGFSVSLLGTWIIMGTVLGILWLYVFGDNPWPTWIEPLISVLFLLIFSGSWLTITVAGYRVGKKLEARSGFKSKHLWLSLWATLLPIAIILLHQLGNGNLGPKSPQERCHDYCRYHGYQSSSTSPQNSGGQTCSCLGQYGAMERIQPIDQLPR